MSKLELIRASYDYNQWANARILQAAGRLSDDELSKPKGASWGSIEANLAHVAAAQIVWLQRWTHLRWNVRPVVEVQRMHGLQAVSEAFGESHAALKEFAAALTEEQLDEVLAYRDSQGNPFARPLWQLMVHLVNHGTQHRSETAMALTALGQSPGDIDYVYFELERAGQR